MLNHLPHLNRLEQSSAGREWLRHLPEHIDACVHRWSLHLEPPYEQSSVSAVFPATMPDGSAAVLKIQFPHRESDQEGEALRRWAGNGVLRLFDSDPTHRALLMERCQPGDHLSTAQPEEALEVLIELLPRLWIPADKPFTSVREEAATWAEELESSWERANRPFEQKLLDTAMEALDTLPKTQGEQVLIHQDLHGDNVLRATREPWLVIDPKPITGEREFSLSPIIRSYEFGHSRKHVVDRLDKLTSALHVNRERARLWCLTQTLAWAFEADRAAPRHIETARWLWQA